MKFSEMPYKRIDMDEVKKTYREYVSNPREPSMIMRRSISLMRHNISALQVWKLNKRPVCRN